MRHKTRIMLATVDSLAVQGCVAAAGGNVGSLPPEEREEGL